MPSPITHLAAGYAVFQVAKKFLPVQVPGKFRHISGLLIFTSILSILPDMDSILGILFNDFGRYHNQGSHSLLVGLFVAILAGGMIRIVRKGSFREWFLVAWLAYESHIILDFFTWGRGVMLFWPITLERFKSPVLLFYGLHWSDGLLSLSHIVTLITEIALILVVYFGFRGFQKFQLKWNYSSKPNYAGED
jgi:inner membrane protein